MPDSRLGLSVSPMPHEELTALLDRQVLVRVGEELAAARGKHPPINSVHEGYAVIAEEVEEFWAWVKCKTAKRDQRAMCDELIQIAAMAIRTATDCSLAGEPARTWPDA